MLIVSLPEEPTIVAVCNYIITRLGQYIDRTNVRYLLGKGKVSLNSQIQKDLSYILPYGEHTLEIFGRRVFFSLRPFKEE